jgi:hypothetical protein
MNPDELEAAMIVYMIDRQGRGRIARFVTEEIARQGLSTRAIGAKPGSPRLPTIKRIKAEDPDVSDTMLRAMGGKLGLPADWLIYIGTGDARRIRNSGAAPDLIRVTLDLFDDHHSPAPRWSDRSL